MARSRTAHRNQPIQKNQPRGSSAIATAMEIQPMSPAGQRVEDVSAIELARWQQVESSGEKSYPSRAPYRDATTGSRAATPGRSHASSSHSTAAVRTSERERLLRRESLANARWRWPGRARR